MKQPNIETQKELLEVNNGYEEIVIPNTTKKVKIGWQKGYTLERLSILELNEGIKEDDGTKEKTIKNRTRFVAKSASIVILNGMKIFFFHWIYWRYLYFIKGYTYEQLEPIIKAAKKKVQVKSYYLSTTLVVQMKITNLQMTNKEANRIQAELLSESGQL